MVEDIVIDDDGFRLNVGMVILNAKNQVFWACRSDCQDAWQFPQGGMLPGEKPQEAMYRELLEEVGLEISQVELLAESKQWFAYELPSTTRQSKKIAYRGQKQKWFLLRLLGNDSDIYLDKNSEIEFYRWIWVDYWYPCDHIIEFKRVVYKSVLLEFAQFLQG